MVNKIQTKQEQIEELKRQIKEEKTKVESRIGKQFLKTFQLDYEDEKQALELINLLADQYNEKTVQNQNEPSYSN
ncbi:hypothetical protein [Virgibacillus siamensis]|uniref:hypothetical protein n=1 Tax=Virgibacillus siamensis TaxID=480071 RepID=UPI000985DA47|nr:hypothetical protein [Virgibacillus siamensis]